MAFQKGITQEEGGSAIYLTLTTSAPRDLARHCPDLLELVSEVGRLDPKARLSATLSFGAECWREVSPQSTPKELTRLREREGKGGKVVSTGGDLFLHIRSCRHDLNFEYALRSLRTLGGLVQVQEEITGFTYLDSRDLTGFIDGTANPKGPERAEVALIGPEDKPFAGGSYLLTQRYVHNLSKWAQLRQEKQESIVGRAKVDSAELEGDRKPETAHVSRAETHVQGEELKIVRHSFPYGTASGEKGLFFIAYCRSAQTFSLMLDRLYGTGEDGLHDQLMEYTRAVTGALFFTPSLSTLAALAK